MKVPQSNDPLLLGVKEECKPMNAKYTEGLFEADSSYPLTEPYPQRDENSRFNISHLDLGPDYTIILDPVDDDGSLMDCDTENYTQADVMIF